MEDERARLEMGFEIMKRLDTVYRTSNQPEKAQTMRYNYEASINRCPPSIKFRIQTRLAELKNS